MYVCMHACMYVCMHACMYVCMCVYVCNSLQISNPLGIDSYISLRFCQALSQAASGGGSFRSRWCVIAFVRCPIDT